MISARQNGTRVLYRLASEHTAALVGEAAKQTEHSVANGQMPHHHHAQQV